MDKDLVKNLPKPEKIATTQALTDMGYSVRKIAEIMGIDEKTVLRYQRKELESEFQQFANTLKKIWLEQDAELIQMTFEEIKKKMPKARFFELVGLYKVVREVNQEKTQQVIGIKGDSIQVEFIKFQK